MTEQQVRKDLLEAMEEPVTIVINGKRRTVPIIMAIYRQVLIKAAQGEFRFAKLVIETRKAAMDEHISVKVRLAEQLLEMEQHLEQHPEDEQGENEIGPWIQEMSRRAWDPDVIA